MKTTGVDAKNLSSYIAALKCGALNVVGVKNGFFQERPDYVISNKAFDIKGKSREDVNIRQVGTHLLMDLWFPEKRVFVEGILDRKISDYGESLVKQTVVITDIEYVIASLGLTRTYLDRPLICRCGKYGDYWIGTRPSCKTCVEDDICLAVEEKRLHLLMNALSTGLISTIGIYSAYISANPGIIFRFAHFDISDIDDLNPRILNDKLLIELWFKNELSKEGVLERRIINGVIQDKLLVEITAFDYVSTLNNRYYW